MIGALRFFRVVDPTPAWMWGLTAAIGAYGGVLIWIDPGSIDSAMGMLMLWQMLAVSRGFVRPASAGYFDPLLVRESRLSIAAGHAIHAAAPVAMMWAALAALEALKGMPAPLALEPGRLSAFMFVSATAWAVSLPAPRLVTGSLWLALLVAAAITRFGVEQYAAMLSRPESASQTAHAIAFVLMCPFLMLESVVPGRATLGVALAAGAVASAACGAMYIARRNYPLEATL